MITLKNCILGVQSFFFSCILFTENILTQCVNFPVIQLSWSHNLVIVSSLKTRCKSFSSPHPQAHAMWENNLFIFLSQILFIVKDIKEIEPITILGLILCKIQETIKVFQEKECRSWLTAMRCTSQS